MFSVLKQTFNEFFEDCCMRMAAALAYYTVFALPPLSVILLMMLGLSYEATGQGGKEAARQDLQEQVKLYVRESAAEEVATIIENAGITGGPLQWVLGIGGVLLGRPGWWRSAGHVERGLGGQARSRARRDEELPDETHFLSRNDPRDRIHSARFDAAHVLGRKLFGGGGPLLRRRCRSWSSRLLFAAMFKYLPDAVVEWKDALVGAGLTAVLFAIGKYGLSYYLSQSNFESQFGAAAAFAILLAWVYYSSLILLFGAEFTQVWAKHQGRRIQPEPGAVRVVEETKHVRDNEAVADRQGT